MMDAAWVRRRIERLASAAALCVTIGCSGSSMVPSDTVDLVAIDAIARDANFDDARADLGMDGHVDAPTDAATDSGSDMGSDVGGEAAQDSISEPAIDARPPTDAARDGPLRPCTTNAECPTGTYCAGAGCGSLGDCQTPPSRCPPVDDAVCGCDHVTYSHPCLAAMAGVRVAMAGACSVVPDAGGPTCAGDPDCAPPTLCCPRTLRCYDPTCTSCCPPLAPDAGACIDDTDCADGRSCCRRTGRCYDGACTTCCA